MITHCTNCTEKDSTRLPDKYQFGKQSVVSIRNGYAVNLCPRCKCPEVMFENPAYTEWLLEGNEPLSFKKQERLTIK